MKSIFSGPGGVGTASSPLDRLLQTVIPNLSLFMASSPLDPLLQTVIPNLSLFIVHTIHCSVIRNKHCNGIVVLQQISYNTIVRIDKRLLSVSNNSTSIIVCLLDRGSAQFTQQENI